MSLSVLSAPRNLAGRLAPTIHRYTDGRRSNSSESRSTSEFPRVQAIREEFEREAEQSDAKRAPRREVSRDMRGEAESSTSPSISRLLEHISSRRPSASLSDRSSSPASKSISRSLNPSWNERNPSAFRDPNLPPRTLKGIHNRQKRAQGNTPAEANAINVMLENMLNNPAIFGRAPDFTSRDRTGALMPPRLFSSPLPPGRANGGRISPRILERLDVEEDHETAEQLDALKEDMGMCRTDVDLINWAKEKVFAPITPPSSDSLSQSDSIGPSFPPVYPRILAHLLAHIRRNYSNPHLVLALFHHAQTQSPESYISGCHAPAYDEVLKTQWESFQDMEAVEAGVREMDANGVAWDRGTARTIGKVVDDVGKEVFQGTGWQEKYGADVHERLARLEDRLQKDVNEQKRMYEAKQKARAAMRISANRFEERREEYGDYRQETHERREEYV